VRANGWAGHPACLQQPVNSAHLTDRPEDSVVKGKLWLLANKRRLLKLNDREVDGLAGWNRRVSVSCLLTVV